jgi:hypothetical protein
MERHRSNLNGEPSTRDDFRAASPGKSAVAVRLALIVLAFLAVLRFVVNLSPAWLWANRGSLFTGIVLIALAALALELLRKRLRGAPRFILTEEGIEITRGRDTISLPYGDVSALSAAVNPLDLRGSALVEAGGLRYLIHAENHTRFLEQLRERTGIEVRDFSFPVFLAKRQWGWLAVLVLLLCFFSLVRRPHPVTAGLLQAAGIAAAAALGKGILESLPNPRDAGARRIASALLVILALGWGAVKLVDWRKSVFGALDISAWTTSLASPTVIDDIPGISLEIPAGWKTARASGAGRHWIAARHGRDDSETILIIAAAPIPDSASGDLAWWRAAAVRNVGVVLDRLGRGTVRRPVYAEDVRVGEDEWPTFIEESILDGSATALTLWHGWGRFTYTITFEKGAPDDEAARELLDSITQPPESFNISATAPLGSAISPASLIVTVGIAPSDTWTLIRSASSSSLPERRL